MKAEHFHLGFTFLFFMQSAVPAFEATPATIATKCRNILILTRPRFGGSLTFSFLYPLAIANIAVAEVDSEETELGKELPQSQKSEEKILELGVVVGRMGETQARVAYL